MKELIVQRAKEVCPTTTAKKLQEGAFLVDVRSQVEVDDVNFDVSNYLHIPLSQFEQRISEIPKDKELIIGCRSGARSLKVTYFLMNHNFKTVSNLQGGLIKWIAKGFPAKGNIESLTASANCDCSKPNCC